MKYGNLHFTQYKEIKMKDTMMDFLKDEQGVGVVEIILILVVLISLVLIFKEQLTTIVQNIFRKISRESSSV